MLYQLFEAVRTNARIIKPGQSLSEINILNMSLDDYARGEEYERAVEGA
jgi:hypothetical protein